MSTPQRPVTIYPIDMKIDQNDTFQVLLRINKNDSKTDNLKSKIIKNTLKSLFLEISITRARQYRSVRLSCKNSEIE